VEIELPDKEENLIYLDMSPNLEKLYYNYAKQYKSKLSDLIEKDEISNSAFYIFEAMLRLRQICLFPSLLDEKYNNIDSPKFDYLSDFFPEVLSEDHKILVFSQFTSVLDIIEKHLAGQEINYVRLDGSTNLNKREKAIKTFQEDEECKVFLLSLKSGGVALNLTAADYVFIFDPWWNPAVEAQAIDRAHRFGQKKKVIAYRLIVKNSIEEKIIKLQESKKLLVDNLISEDKSIFKSLSKEELLDLFS